MSEKPEQVIEFGDDDWGRMCEKADTPGRMFRVNGALCSLSDVSGHDDNWDGRKRFAMIFVYEAEPERRTTVTPTDLQATHEDAARCVCNGRGAYAKQVPTPLRYVPDDEPVALLPSDWTTTLHACQFHWRDGELSAEDVAVLSASGIRTMPVPLSPEQMLEAARMLAAIPDDRGEA